MYKIINIKNKYKLVDESLEKVEGFHFGKKAYKVNGIEIENLIIYSKKLTHNIVRKQVDKKYKKLIALLMELLVSDDDSGDNLREALNQIEKFRQIIKNKYRAHLKKKDLELMSKKLKILKSDIDKKIDILENEKKETISKGTHR